MKKTLNKIGWLVKGAFVKYVLGLVLSKERRVCTKIAEYFGISHDVIYRYLTQNASLAALFPDMMIKLAQHFHKIKNGWLVVDDTALSKIYAQYIEGIHWIYNSSLKRPERGLCIVVIAWTNGDITIPIGFDWWFSKKIDKEKHQTKIKIAQKLVNSVYDITYFRKLLADAAYISVDMIAFLNGLQVSFITRIHSSRKVETEDGTCVQMKNHPKLKLMKNLRSKIVKAKVKGYWVNIVVFKRKKKNSYEHEKVFLVTNIYAKADEIIKMYDIRWKIEPMFRTLKQSLGLMHCSARSISKQTLHINAGFFGYAFLQHQKFYKKFSCPEDVIKSLRDSKLRTVTGLFNRFCRDFAHVA